MDVEPHLVSSYLSKGRLDSVANMDFVKAIQTNLPHKNRREVYYEWNSDSEAACSNCGSPYCDGAGRIRRIRYRKVYSILQADLLAIEIGIRTRMKKDQEANSPERRHKTHRKGTRTPLKRGPPLDGDAQVKSRRTATRNQQAAEEAAQLKQQKVKQAVAAAQQRAARAAARALRKSL